MKIKQLKKGKFDLKNKRKLFDHLEVDNKKFKVINEKKPDLPDHKDRLLNEFKLKNKEIEVNH